MAIFLWLISKGPGVGEGRWDQVSTIPEKLHAEVQYLRWEIKLISTWQLDTVVVPKCFIKHVCFIVLYFHGHAFFSLEIAKMCFFVLYFLKNVLYFCEFFKWVEFLFQVLIYNTKIDEL